MGLYFGKKIKNIRKQKKVTIKELARKSNVTTAQIINIEKGRNNPSSTTIAKLAKALDVDYEYLFKEYIK